MKELLYILSGMGIELVNHFRSIPLELYPMVVGINIIICFFAFYYVPKIIMEDAQK